MRRMSILAFFLLSFLMMSLTPPSSEGTEIRLRPVAQAKGAEVRLAEIAEIPTADLTKKRLLGRLRIADAPPDGKSFHLSREFVASVLQRAGYRDAEVTGAEQVLVRRARRLLRKERIESEVRRYLAERLASQQGSVEVTTIHIPQGKILLPREEDAWLVVKVPPQTRFLGRTPLIVSVMQGPTEVRRIWISADISVFTKVPVAVVPIRTKQRLSAAQFEMRRQNLASLPDNVVTSPEELDGAQSLRPISPGEIIRKSDVRFPYLVKQGNLVRLYARRGSLVITAIGKALDAGRKGELVRVINIDSNKPVQGRVVEKSSVEVLF